MKKRGECILLCPRPYPFNSWIYTHLTGYLFNLEFQFKSVLNLEFQPEFVIKLDIPILIYCNEFLTFKYILRAALTRGYSLFAVMQNFTVFAFCFFVFFFHLSVYCINEKYHLDLKFAFLVWG